MERTERLKAIRDGVDPDAQSHEPQTVEEQLQWMRDIGIKGVPDSVPEK